MKRRRAQHRNVSVAGVNSSRLLDKLSGEPASKYQLRLYVAGTNLNSSRAIQHVRGLCKSLLPAHCEVEVIDLYQQPALAKRDDVVAAPALIKISPPPARTFIGDLSDLGKVLAGLGIVLSRSKDGRFNPPGQ